MVEPVDYKRTKGNQECFGGKFGYIIMKIFNNRNKKNQAYRMISFGKRMPVGWASLPIMPGEIANLQAALDAARKWLRDK